MNFGDDWSIFCLFNETVEGRDTTVWQIESAFYQVCVGFRCVIFRTKSLLNNPLGVFITVYLPSLTDELSATQLKRRITRKKSIEGGCRLWVRCLVTKVSLDKEWNSRAKIEYTQTWSFLAFSSRYRFNEVLMNCHNERLMLNPNPALYQTLVFQSSHYIKDSIPIIAWSIFKTASKTKYRRSEKLYKTRNPDAKM